VTPWLLCDLGDLDRNGLSPRSISVEAYCTVGIMVREDKRQKTEGGAPVLVAFFWLLTSGF
jgi:hypothetical protein